MEKFRLEQDLRNAVKCLHFTYTATFYASSNFLKQSFVNSNANKAFSKGMVFATTDDRNVSQGNENPVCDIGAVMDQSNNTRQSKATRGYKLLQITGEHLETEELCRMHQSMYVTKEPEEMISIITIKNNCQRPYSAGEYLTEFTKAIQDYANQSEDHYTHDSLGLTVDYVKQSYAQDLDQTDIATGQYNDIEAIVDESITKNFSKIVFDACKRFFIGQMSWFLCRFADRLHLDGYTETELITEVRGWIEEHLAYIGKIYHNSKEWSNYFGYKGEKSTILHNIYLEIRSRIESLVIKRDTGTESDLYQEYYEIVSKKYLETLKQESIKLMSFFLPMVETEDMKAEYITTVCLLIDKLDDFSEYSGNQIYDENINEDNINKFCNQETCLNLIHKFFTRIEFISAYMQYVTRSTANTDAAHCKMQSERTTKLVVQGKITVDCIPHLCCALQDNDVFANLALDQYIYVKIDDIESESKSKTFITKRDESTVSGKTRTMKVGYCTHVKVVGLDTKANELVSEAENCEGCEEVVTEKNEDLTDKDK